MKMLGPAALVVLRSILLQQAALKQADKSRSHTKAGPGRVPHRKTQPIKEYGYKGKTFLARPKRLERATGSISLDYDTERRRQVWLKKYQKISSV